MRSTILGIFCLTFLAAGCNESPQNTPFPDGGGGGTNSDLTFTPSSMPVDLAYPGPDFAGTDLTPKPGATSSGTFDNGQSIDERSGPAQVFVADFTGDGKMDLLVLRLRWYAAPSVVLRTGDGNGGFGPAAAVWTSSAAGGWNPFAFAVSADVNNDGKMDLVIWDGNTQVTSLIQGAAGAFTTTLATSADYAGKSFGVGDVNSDGRADLIIGSNDGFRPCVGDGSGNYAAGTAVTIAGGAGGFFRPRVMDVDGDGRADVTLTSISRLFWAPGKANGTFDTVRATEPLSGSLGIADYALGDFDGDALRDWVFLTRDIDGANPTLGISFVQGTAAGVFAAPSMPKPVAKGLQVLVGRDLDGDGTDDVGILSDDPFPTSEPGLYVLLGGSGGPGSPLRYPFRATGRIDLKAAKLTTGAAVDFVAVGQMGGATGNGDVYVYRGR